MISLTKPPSFRDKANPNVAFVMFSFQPELSDKPATSDLRFALAKDFS